MTRVKVNEYGRLNEYGQALGPALPDFTPGEMPSVQRIEGQYCTIEHIDVVEHCDDVWDFYSAAVADPSDWTYLYQEPFGTKAEVEALLEDYQASENPYFFAVRLKDPSITKEHPELMNKVLGTFSLMRIDTKNRSCEMGRVIYAPEFRKTRAATEAQYLMMRYVFEDLQYRRYEWKCDSLNAPSRNAAKRLGFQFEGRFRNATVYKGRSRDTDCLSVIDSEWSQLKKRFEKWLSSDNFDENGQQKTSLTSMHV